MCSYAEAIFGAGTKLTVLGKKNVSEKTIHSSFACSDYSRYLDFIRYTLHLAILRKQSVNILNV